MALTLGTGPLSPDSQGEFNFESNAPAHLLYFEESPRRVRVAFNGETIADSTGMKLLHESNSLPVYYFPVEDVRMELLEATDHSSRCPVKGDASYWSVKVGDRVAENAAWGYPSPLDSAPWLAGHVAFYWDKMDAWFEEDEEIFVHPRDPYHRVDVLDSTRRVKISINDEVIAESDRPKILFETGLPPRYYIPEEDVRTELLVPSDTATQCPYKGTASYWSVKAGDDIVEDVVWYYPDPLPDVSKISGYLSLFNERVDLEVDGEAVARPHSPFSRSIRGARR